MFSKHIRRVSLHYPPDFAIYTLHFMYLKVRAEGGDIGDIREFRDIGDFGDFRDFGDIGDECYVRHYKEGNDMPKIFR